MSEFKSLYNEFTGDFNTLTADNIIVDGLNSEYVYVDVIEPFTLSGSVVVDGYDVAATFNEHEHALSTGVYNGGLLVIASATTFSITDGAGVVVQNTSNPHAITPVSWTNKTGIAATYINSALITFVSIDSAGAVIQSTSRPTNAETRTQIYLGVLVHTDLATITAVNQQQQFINAPSLQVRDLLEGLGPILNIDGNTITGNTGALTFTKSAGTVLAYGANYYNSPLNPHRLNIDAVNTTSIAIEYRLVNGTNFYTGIIPGLIDPNYYESGGSRVAVSVNKYTVQRVYLFTSSNIKLQYGQTQYNTLAAAKDAFRNDPFTVEASIKSNGVLIAYIIIKAGTTSLTNTSDCFIINAGKFEGTSASAGGTTLQLSYTNSETPEIITDTTRGALTIKRGSASDADVVLEVLDGSGVKSYSATGNNVYLNKLSTGVLHSDISGLITSSPVVAADISGGVAQIIPTLTFTGSYLVPFVDNLNAPANIYVGGLNYNASTQTLSTSYITTDSITEVNEGDGVSLIGARFISGAYLSAGVLHCSASGVISSSLIVNADISGGIEYSKLNLTNGIINNDIHPSAAIAYTKLNLNNGITNTDINSGAAVSYSKLNLSGSIVSNDISGINSSKIVVNSNITPTASGYDLGSVSNRWNNVYCETISANSFTLSGNTLTADYINEATTGSGVIVDGVLLKDGYIADTAYTAGYLKSDSAGVITSDYLQSDDMEFTDIQPAANNAFKCGLSGYKWLEVHTNKLYATELSNLSGALTNLGQGVVKVALDTSLYSGKIVSSDVSGALPSSIIAYSSNVIPTVNDTYSLGISGTIWNEGHVDVLTTYSNLITNSIAERTLNAGVDINGVMCRPVGCHATTSGWHLGNLSGCGGSLSGAFVGSVSGFGYLSGTTTGLHYGTCSGTLNGTGTISGTINGTSTTQAAATNNTTIATTAYIDTQINNIKNGYTYIKSSQSAGGTGTPAATYCLTSGAGIVVASGSSNAGSYADWFYLDSTRYTSINGSAPRLRVYGMLSRNATSLGTTTFTLGLYPYSATAGAGGTISNTLGSVVSGSNGAAWVNPGTSATSYAVGSLFSFPSTGIYCLGLVISATTAANSFFVINAYLELVFN